MIDPGQFRDYVIDPTLEDLGMFSTAGVELVMGTAIQESHLTYLKQLGDGPALGVCQMEPATYDDIWTNYLQFQSELRRRVLAIARTDEKPGAELMIHDLKFAVAMCRIHYRRVRDPLPTAGDIEAQAAYWKRFYNTPLGKGTVEEYIHNWTEMRG
jgi:hypothetical protein